MFFFVSLCYCSFQKLYGLCSTFAASTTFPHLSITIFIIVYRYFLGAFRFVLVISLYNISTGGSVSVLQKAVRSPQNAVLAHCNR